MSCLEYINNSWCWTHRPLFPLNSAITFLLLCMQLNILPLFPGFITVHINVYHVFSVGKKAFIFTLCNLLILYLNKRLWLKANTYNSTLNVNVSLHTFTTDNNRKPSACISVTRGHNISLVAMKDVRPLRKINLKMRQATMDQLW